MRIGGRLALTVALFVLLASPPGTAQGPLRSPRAPGPGAPGAPPDESAVGEPRPGDAAGPSKLPTVKIGALLPLTGASAWFGTEMRRGLELAIADLKRSPQAVPQSGTADQKRMDAGPRAIEDLVSRPGFQLALEALDVDTLNTRQAVAQFNHLAAAGVPVVFTASATPTLAIYPLAASRDILVVHQGLVTGRFPGTSRTLVHTRPSVPSRVDALAAEARERGFGRLALLAAGDEFGKTVRATLSARWRSWGMTLAQEESLSLDAPDLRSRLRQLTRLAPDAVFLGFQGPDLGDLARQLREAGFAGALLALDDDPSVLLAAGPALEPAVILSEAFVPEPGSLGARFAEAYKKGFGSEPSRYAANAYEAVAIIAEAIRSAQHGGRGAPGGARLREALLARRSFPSLYGGHVLLREDGTVERPLALFTVEQGKLAFVRYVMPAVRSTTRAVPLAAA